MKENGEWVSHEPGDLPEPMAKELGESLDKLSKLAIIMQSSTGHKIKSEPLILENQIELEEKEELEEQGIDSGDRYFRITVQEIEEDEFKQTLN